jgi:hypothetical protein
MNNQDSIEIGNSKTGSIKIYCNFENKEEALKKIDNAIFCLKLKVFKGNGSFDVINLDNGDRIQIKACSVEYDLTSFGPKSVWDKIYFLDFHRLDETFDVYLIPNEYIYGQKTNKLQTMKDQQGEKRRPRFSIKREIIEIHKIKPVKTCRL